MPWVERNYYLFFLISNMNLQFIRRELGSCNGRIRGRANIDYNSFPTLVLLRKDMDTSLYIGLKISPELFYTLKVMKIFLETNFYL
jgi:hypothetical protein